MFVPGDGRPLQRVAWCTRRRAGLLRGGHRGRRRRLPDRRDLRAAGPPRARNRRRVPGLRAPRHRALRRARGGGRRGGALRASSTRSSTSESGVTHTARDHDGRRRPASARSASRAPSCAGACAGLRRRGRHRRDAARVGVAGPRRGGGAASTRRRPGCRAARVACRCSSPRGCRRAWTELPWGRVDARCRRAPRRAASNTRCAWCSAGAAVGDRDRADPQGGARRRRRRLSRPHRDAAGAGHRGRRRPAAGAHDAGQRRAARRAGDDPPVAAPRHRRRHLRRRAADAAHRARCGCGAGVRRGRASRSPGSTRMPARAGCSATRSCASSGRPCRPRAAEGIDAHGPFAPDTVFMRARHAAGHAGEFDLVVAMTHDHGLIPVKYLGRGAGRQRDARPAVRAHQPRPRHRLRHRRPRPSPTRPAWSPRCDMARRLRSGFSRRALSAASCRRARAVARSIR